MATISTHVLDTARGVPAEGIALELFRLDGDFRTRLAGASTNADGRTETPLPAIPPGTYALVFAVAEYFRRLDTETFYDEITVRFRVTSDGDRYHVPLLLAPWGYSTYRGS